MSEVSGILCFRCDYDLQGLPEAGNCPECGLPVALSRRPSTALVDARPRWLCSVAIGIWLMLVGMLVACGWPYAFQFFGDAIAELHDRLLQHFGKPVAGFAYTFGWDLTATLVVAATWLITQREGYAPADSADRRRRLIIRAAGVLPVLIVAWLHAVGAGIVPSWLWLRNIESNLAYAPLPILGFWHFASVARRIGRRSLVRQCLIAGIGGSLALVAQYFAFTVFDLRPPSVFTETPQSVAVDWAFYSVVVFSTFFWLWWLVLAVRFGVIFTSAARRARQTWREAERTSIARH